MKKASSSKSVRRGGAITAKDTLLAPRALHLVGIGEELPTDAEEAAELVNRADRGKRVSASSSSAVSRTTTGHGKKTSGPRGISGAAGAKRRAAR